jgi:hypothetical protein
MTEAELAGMTYEQLLQLLLQNAALNSEGQMLDGGRAAIDVGGQAYNLESLPGGDLRLWNEYGTAGNGDELNRGYQISPDGSVTRPWSDYTSSDQTMHAVSGLGGLAAMPLAAAYLPGLMGGMGGAAPSGVGAAQSGVAAAAPAAAAPAAGAAGAAIPELGLIANPATAGAAMSAGIPASMMAAGAGAAGGLLGGSALPALGAVLGGLSGNQDSTTTQTPQIPEHLRPYANDYAAMGWGLANKPFQPYQGERVAGFTPDQIAGMDMTRGVAGQNSPLWGQAQSQLSDVIGGKYLSPDSNPWLRGMYDSAASRVSDQFARGTAANTDAQFARQGAFGGSAWSEQQGANARSLGDSLSGLASNLYGNAYQQERGAQDAATRFAPQFAGAQQQYGLNAADALYGSGARQQALGQARYDANYQQYQDEQAWPFKTFGVAQSMFAPSNTPGQSATQPGVGVGQGAMGGLLGGLAFQRMWG